MTEDKSKVKSDQCLWLFSCRDCDALFSHTLFALTLRGRCGFHDSKATAAGPYCLRLGGRDGCLSVWFWVLEGVRLSTNDSPFLSFFSAFISRVMYLETLWHYSRLIGFIVCAFYTPPIFLCILCWLSLHYSDAFAPRHFVSFLWVFSRFLVSSRLFFKFV